MVRELLLLCLPCSSYICVVYMYVFHTKWYVRVSHEEVLVRPCLYQGFIANTQFESDSPKAKPE